MVKLTNLSAISLTDLSSPFVSVISSVNLVELENYLKSKLNFSSTSNGEENHLLNSQI